MSNSNQDPRFVHLSDAHIGHRQYGVKKRRDDMFMSFNTSIYEAVEKSDVDFAVFGGDLFHNKDVNARALSDAEEGLSRFEDAGVPVAAVRGNHDANLYKEDLNWLEYLHSRGKLILLEADLSGEDASFEKHDFDDPGTSSGFVDLNGVRVFGVQYLGQRTSDNLSKVAEAIEQVNEREGEPEATVLIGHFGVEGHIPGMSGGISFNALEPVEDAVDYLALGHLHKKYSHGNWLFNPGSLEAHDTRQARWDLGYFIVDVEDGSIDPEFHKSKRRPFFEISFEVDAHDSPDELESAFTDKVEDSLSNLEQVQQKPHFQRSGENRDPVIDLRLEGLLQFSRSRLDTDVLREIVEKKTGALYVNLNDATESKETASIIQELDGGEDAVRDEQGQIDRGKLESAVFQRLAGQDSQYGEKEEDVAETLSMVKKSVVAGENPETVAETIKKRRRDLLSQGSDQE
jgi:DNA repair exonuclease SbcCD nuclease subunit